MEKETRRVGKKAFGKYHLLKIKDCGASYQGLFFVDVPTLKEFDKISEDEVDKHILSTCPFDVPHMCFPASAFVFMRGKCQKVPEDHRFIKLYPMKHSIREFAFFSFNMLILWILGVG